MLAASALCCVLLWCGGVGGAGDGSLAGFRSTYSLITTVEVGDASRVSYRLRSALQVVLREPSRLHFTLEKPQLLMHGKELDADYYVQPSLWDSHQLSTFEADWDNGRISTAYLDPTDHPDVLNYKKSLVSMFQFQASEGVHNETDISGDCEVLYETLPDGDIRKMKRGCSRDGAARWKRVTRFMGGERLTGLRVDEVVTLGAEQAQLRARSLHELRLESRDKASPQQAVEYPATSLPLELPPLPAEDALNKAMKKYEVVLHAEQAGAGGDAAAAAAAVPLAGAIRAASKKQLLGLLDSVGVAERVGLARALGLAASEVAASAARAGLRMAAADAPLEEARAYCAGLAQALRPAAGALGAALRLAAEARSTSVAAAALLAAAAAAPRAQPPLTDDVREYIRDHMTRCKEDEECMVVGVEALGNLRDPRDLEALVQHAERGGRARAEAALGALRRAAADPPGPLLRRLALLAAGEARPLAVRAAALDVAVTRGVRRGDVVPLHLEVAARQLAAQRAPAAAELRRLLWQRLGALRARPGVRALVRALRGAAGWAARAAPGASAALRRAPGWAAGGWAARLDSVQVAAGGALTSGRVALLARGAGALEPLLAVEVRARGLAALGGGQPEDGDEGTAASLALEAGGAAMPPLQLFSGQAELLSLVWAGAGSEDTPVVRALRPLRDDAAALPLAAGAALVGRAHATLALALDARATVSLWQRTARAKLTLRGAVAARAEGAVAVEWATLTGAASAELAPSLGVAADVDLYAGAQVCVRAAAADAEARAEARAGAAGAGGARAVRRRRGARLALAGRTLSLGRDNDSTCRSLRSDDDV